MMARRSASTTGPRAWCRTWPVVMGDRCNSIPLVYLRQSSESHFASEGQDEMVRLSKLMAQRGIASRREADRYISSGDVLVDGVAVTTLGTKVPTSCDIQLTAGGGKEQRQKRTIMLNKPAGVVSNLAEHGYETAITLCTAANFFADPRLKLATYY